MVSALCFLLCALTIEASRPQRHSTLADDKKKSSVSGGTLSNFDGPSSATAAIVGAGIASKMPAASSLATRVVPAAQFLANSLTEHVMATGAVSPPPQPVAGVNNAEVANVKCITQPLHTVGLKPAAVWPEAWVSTFKTDTDAPGNHRSENWADRKVVKEVNSLLGESGASFGPVQVLDLGGGTANFYTQFDGKLTSQLNYICVDKTPAQKCCGYPGDNLAIFANASFDLVIGSYMLHHMGTAGFDTLKEMVREMWRVLKPTGKMLIQEDSVPNEACKQKYQQMHEPRGIFYNATEWVRFFKSTLKLQASAELQPSFYVPEANCPAQFHLPIVKQ